jgi:periplasmic protein TonB
MEYHKRPEADIRLKYQFLTELGLAFSLLIFVVTFIVSKQFDVEVTVKNYTPDEIQVEEIERTIQQKTIPKPSRPTFTVAAEDEDVVEDEDIIFEDDDNWDIAPPPPPPMASEEEIVDFFAIEEQPELIGGTKALYKAVKYPEMAQRAGVEGLAQIRFVVGPDGTTRDFEIMGERPEGLGFGQAAIDALSKVRFKPGKQRDRFVPVRMSQVIKFELN